MEKGLSRTFYILVLFIISLSSEAKMYKCIDENGDVTYSQTACQGDQTIDKVIGGQKQQSNLEDCKYAGQFSKVILRSMRAGNDADVVFDQYGGINALSKSSIAIINYVYSFKQTPDVSANRISSLTMAKCNARSFGDVACKDLPDDFQRTIGPYGCDEDKALEQGIPPAPQTLPNPASGAVEAQPMRKSSATPPANASNQDQAVISDCKARYDQRIAEVDVLLREGYDAAQGEALNAERRRLVDARYSDCR